LSQTGEKENRIYSSLQKANPKRIGIAVHANRPGIPYRECCIPFSGENQVSLIEETCC